METSDKKTEAELDVSPEEPDNSEELNKEVEIDPTSRFVDKISVPDELKDSGTGDWLDYLEKKKAEAERNRLSSDDLERMRKRHRAQKITAGITDAVRSIANLVAVHNYAPNGFEPVSPQIRERMEKEKAEYKAKEDEYYRYAMEHGKAKAAQAKHNLDAWDKAQNLNQRERNNAANIDFKMVAEAGRNTRAADAEEGRTTRQAAALQQGQEQFEQKQAQQQEQFEQKQAQQQSRVNSKRSGSSTSNKYITVTEPSGAKITVYESELDDYIAAMPEDVRRTYYPIDYSSKKQSISREAKRAMVADYIRNHGSPIRTARQSPTNSTNSSTGKKSPTA